MSRDYKLKIKTELCKSWVKTQSCAYGPTCAFAHGEHELQKKKHVPSRYKTKLCQQFHENQYCPYGVRCQFIHSQKLVQLYQMKEDNDAIDVKKYLSYRQILNENIECLKQRLISSQNPFLNEFNLIYKDIVNRLEIFEQITNGVVIQRPSSSQDDKESGEGNRTEGAYGSEATNNDIDIELAEQNWSQFNDSDNDYQSFNDFSEGNTGG